MLGTILIYTVIVLFCLLLLGLYARLTNPFFRFTVVSDPLKDFSFDIDLELNEKRRFVVRTRKIFKGIALFKSGWHIVVNAWSKKSTIKLNTLSEIIDTIHRLRFAPHLPFIISGDHFSMLYPRSLGIFYYSVLDPRIPSSQEDWENRQRIYAKTLLYALKVFSQSDRLATTIVPISRHSVALLNIYAYPSDTLYSILVAFENLTSSDSLEKRYPYTSPQAYTVFTQQLAEQMLERYTVTLERHWQKYTTDVIDPQTGLIKKHWLLSGTKDIARRSCAFYDNVIYWRTWQLAQNLGIAESNRSGLADLKALILDTFWVEKQHVFLEDLSEHSVERSLGSSDWLIAYQTGFLSPDIEEDCVYLEKAVNTIMNSGEDQPFGLSYHMDYRAWQPYLPVKIAAPLYASQVIWSHWGIEYIKLLAHLGQVTKNKKYIARAQEQLAQYEKNIVTSGGYPEVYSPSGEPYKHHGYTSVHLTGWIINFEQAREMVRFVSKR